MGVDTERTSVRTYIPAYQRELWERHAEELNMSRSEFIRTMVQAGRRRFDDDEEGPPPIEHGGHEDSKRDPEDDEHESVQAPEKDVDSRILELLDSEGPLPWDELLAELTGDIEQRLDDALERLQRENRVQYSGRHGGYTRLEDDGD